MGQAALEAELRTWLPLWVKASRQAETHPLNWDVELGLPSIAVADLRHAAETFPAGTALGWDSFHPRLLLQLPEEKAAEAGRRAQ